MAGPLGWWVEGVALDLVIVGLTLIVYVYVYVYV